jgi:anti-sigma regulatory factor (Ser/Thr protein kinase)
VAPHLAVAVTEPSQVGEGRRLAVRLAQERGFDAVASGRVALVATELGTNLSRHAQGGRLLLAAGETDAGAMVEVLSLDDGPGMAEPERCLKDGYSTSGTPGTGLGAVRRLADEFSMFSLPGKGTVVAARIVVRTAAAAGAPPPVFAVGAVRLAAPGETVSGDDWAFAAVGTRAAAIVADGLGHGPLAAVAAGAALQVFAAAHDAAPAPLIQRAHAALHGTRGAAVAVVALDAAAGTLVFAGAGNIAGRLVSGVDDRTLLSQHGTVGLQIRRVQDVHYPWPPHAVLVLHSDGVTTRWKLGDVPGLLQCHPVVLAAWLVRDHCRGRDDTTVVVIRRR